MNFGFRWFCCSVKGSPETSFFVGRREVPFSSIVLFCSVVANLQNEETIIRVDFFILYFMLIVCTRMVVTE